MKILKKISVVLMAAVLMCGAVALTGCSSDESESNIDENGEVTYKVSAVDALGNAYTSGVIAKFMQNGTQIAMQVCDESGVATKKLKAGEYDVELSFTDGDENYHYEKDGMKVTSEKPELKAVVSHAVTGEGTSLYADSKEYEAYRVGVGCTYVQLDTEKRSYFLFAPTEAGSYEISVVDGTDVQIGYYGAPHYVQAQSVEEVTDNKFTTSISASMIGTGNTGTTVLVIGIDSTSATNCVIGVERIGDPEHTLADEPWTIYEKTTTLSEFTLPAGATLAEFDITAASDAYTLVYNEADGFYHMNTADGPLVLVRLTKDPKYIACFKTILDNSGVVKYFFDENEEFIKKESYSECLLEYIEYAEEKEGTYPLTEDLKYIIQQRGEYVGWWNVDSSFYLFVDEMGNKMNNVNTDIAWLFMCCYIEQ